jgi:serine/threonine-protein phosphatase PGAM5
MDAWDRYTRPSPAATRHDLLICHGNVIRWFVCRALGVDTRQWTRMEIGNTSITVIEIQPNGATQLLLYNDTSHVPLGQQSWVDRIPDFAAPAAR